MKFASLARLLPALAWMLVAAELPSTERKAPVITKEELKAKLGSQDLIVVDVRLDEQWRFSNRKIPGAVHENPAVLDWVDKYPKEKTIVFY